MYVMVAIIAYNTITINAILKPLLCDKSSFINLIFKHEPIKRNYGGVFKGVGQWSGLPKVSNKLKGYALLNYSIAMLISSAKVSTFFCCCKFLGRDFL